MKNKKIIEKPISRSEASKLDLKILHDAEQARLKAAERDAKEYNEQFKNNEIWIPMYSYCVYESQLSPLGYYWKRKDAAKHLRKHIKEELNDMKRNLFRKHPGQWRHYIHHKCWRLKKEKIK